MKSGVLSVALSAHPLSFREHFGERVALYFAYIYNYTRWLIVPSIIGVVVYIVGTDMSFLES